MSSIKPADFSSLIASLEGTPWHPSNDKDEMGLSMVILSKKSNQWLSVAKVRGDWSGIHGCDDDVPSILPEHYGKYKHQSNELIEFDGPEDILPWLHANMDKETTFKGCYWE